MILPRPTPLASVSMMSNASISGCASRKPLASSMLEPDGELVADNCGLADAGNGALVSRHEALRNIAEGSDQAVDLRLLGRRRHQHHVVERRDQRPAIDQRDMDRRLQGGRVCRFGLAAVPQGTGRTDEL